MYVLSRFNDVSSKRSVNFLCSTDLEGFCWQPPEDALPPMLMAELPFLPLIAFVVTDPKNITGKRAVVSWVREMFEKKSRRKHMQTRSSFKVDGKYMYIYIYIHICRWPSWCLQKYGCVRLQIWKKPRVSGTEGSLSTTFRVFKRVNISESLGGLYPLYSPQANRQRMKWIPCFTYIWVILLINIGKYTILRDGGFKYFLFSPCFGDMIQFHSYFR